ncbi:MAG: DEAD/DEAH box helicase [Polyangiaceae bacterium]|nr:DEAD/DEAH box helicase [Polyangiaceae bacterium]MCW5792428.1 DEAD/DEAH box helicase [Polyangiaceae bacterium]
MNSEPAPGLDVFALRDALVAEYERFATSFTTIFAADIQRQVRDIYAHERYWPEPLIQINPTYKRTTDVGKLADQGALDPKCKDIFQVQGAPLSLYKHQEQAIAAAAAGDSYVVTTGTGSGKSLCFFIPIVHWVLAEKRQGGPARTRAIIIYPMNALANSQLEELGKFVENVPGAPPITFARYTGQEDIEERRRIAENPPDILLTNFMMLELLMTRQEEVDRQVIDHCVGLRFLVLDELHTYRGRQGADVALLVRRVRERLSPDRQLQCIGTSATMASEGSLEDKRRVVARVASKLFATTILDSNIIVETLERITNPLETAKSVEPALSATIDLKIPRTLTNAELAEHPLAIWVETRLGVTFSDTDQRWVRARPMTVTEAVAALVEASGRPERACREALRELLLASSIPERDRTGQEQASGRSFFAFKLHQFISGAGHAFATLEPPGRRVVTVDGQQYLPNQPEKRLYPLHFCRECGQEYHPVRITDEQGAQLALPRSIDDAQPVKEEDEDEPTDGGDGAEQVGFLTLHPQGDAEFTFNDRDEDYPETWLEYDASGNAKLKRSYRGVRPRELPVTPSGRITPSGARAWFIPGRFRFCLRCAVAQSSSASDRNRLASLSAEGRSSATTVLVASALRWMHGEQSGLDRYTRKLLGFTDNRQDAALQAGHFNDFLFVSLLRAGLLGALRQAGAEGLRSERLGEAVQRALGFDRASPDVRAEWLAEPNLRGINLQDAEGTLRDVLAYRVWYDQRRGWRYTNPNLEQLGLVRIVYRGLDELASDQEPFDSAHPLLKHATPEVRAGLFHELFDHLRKWMAIESRGLERTGVQQMVNAAHGRIRAPWGFSAEEKPRWARQLMLEAPSRKGHGRGDLDLIVRGGSRSGLGRTLRESRLWGGSNAVRNLKSKEMDTLIEDLLRAAAVHGLVSKAATPFEQPGWQLVDKAVVFHLGEPEVGAGSSKENAFFRDLYGNLASLLTSQSHPLFGFEAREHTAQVDSERRALREKRFRYGEKEQQELSADEEHLREIGEAKRFLPVLFCSPTMELGVDISALNVVHMRNVPPTPANYAQRSGRAGRSGQAALVLTYASAQSPHDQYFFREPRAMVHGEVKAPLLDLANRDLVDSHLQAVWLSCVEEPLDASIANLLVLAEPARPLREDLRGAINEARVRERAVGRIEQVLDLIAEDLTPDSAPWYTGREAYAASIASAAADRFSEAFNRWRDLFAAAEEQRDAARRTMDDYAAPQNEKRAAQSRHAQAMDQLDLLQRGTSSSSSDFYTYRYLATEGFLPGYNFPRLPLMAYVPKGNERGRQTYLQRPRFLALSEFGPNSLVYHEGRAYRVVRALLSLGQRDASTPDVLLPTKSVRICAQCGAGHFDDQASMCHACGTSLGTAEIVNNVYRIENVATQQTDAITANDEERRRQGYELQTTFRWAQRDHEPDVRVATVSDAAGDIARLAYGAGAEITRLNKGLRRRADKTTLGFKIDPVSGYWQSDQPGKEPRDPTISPRQWIVPSVQDHKNALLFTPLDEALTEVGFATLQHALLRGMEAVFQLEEGEILAEPMPTRDARTGFLCYEATEGGAGVLARLLSEPSSLAMVARRALQVMHFDVTEESTLPESVRQLADEPESACVAACYRCLMSYYNQPDHELIDRRDETVQKLLLRLAAARVQGAITMPPPASASWRGGGDWAAEASARQVPPADAEPLMVEGAALPLVWRRHYVVALQEQVPEGVLSRLDELGFEVIRFEARPGWQAAFERLVGALGAT